MTPIIALHLAAAILALIIGPTVLWLAKGTARHKLLGRIWALAMLVTALSSFGIRVVNHGQFSWIHLLSVLTLVGLARAILAIRRGDIGGHKAAMRGLFIGLALAGVAAVATPQRFLHEMVVGWMPLLALGTDQDAIPDMASPLRAFFVDVQGCNIRHCGHFLPEEPPGAVADELVGVFAGGGV